MRICKVCKETKPIELFHKNGKGWFRHQCINCINSICRNNYNCKKAEYKNRQLLNRYKISLEEYERILKEQEFKCKICKTDKLNNIGKRNLAVDHNHETGEVRALLCNKCNLGVDFLEKNPGWGDKAIAYLEKYK